MPNLRPQELLILLVVLVFLLVVVAFVVWLAVSLTSRSGRSTGLQVPLSPGSSAGQGQFCHQCGSSAKPDARFCSDCGRPQ